MKYKILAINPGSTSTKISVYENQDCIFSKTLRHSTEEISKYKKITDEYDFRMNIILDSLKEENIELNSLSAVVGRGGLLKFLEGGTYKVNEKMLEDLKVGVMGEHASNLGGILANEVAKKINVDSYIVDPVVVDELKDIARISGMPELQRKSILHALNQKSVARKYANDISKKYSDLNLIVAHLGGGISVGAHERSRIIDVNNALDGEGPFSPERTGDLPVDQLVDYCYTSSKSREEIRKMIKGNGGLNSYLGTNDAMEVDRRIDSGDKEAALIYEALAYQVSKEIGKMSACLKGDVDAIILTGGIAYDKKIVNWISESCEFIAPIVVIPGEDEMTALTLGALRVLSGEEEAKDYI